MRLEELYLDGFGRFHQQTLKISEPVTVLYGPNEAGKSTLLAFIRAILFGFPTQFNNHYPPFAGGKHGGWIRLSNDDGNAYKIERFAGKSGGLSVVGANNVPVADADAVLRQLTDSAPSDLFKNVFAFSLDELQEATSLPDSSIYSAGQGAPKLPSLGKKLDEARRRIYANRGSNQEVPKLLNVLKNVDEKLKSIEGNAKRFGELSARKSDIGRELQAADNDLSTMNARRADIDNLVNGWNDWLELSQCEIKLKDIPRFERFPDDPIARLDNFESQIQQTRGDRDETAEQLRQVEKAASVPIPGENLLNDVAKIEGVRRDRGSYDGSVRDLPERQAELQGQEVDFATLLGDLGHGWGEAELLAFDTSLVSRNQIDNWKQRISESRERAQRTQSLLEQERRTLQSQQAESQEALDKLPPEPPLSSNALAERQDHLRTARGRLAEYDRAQQSYESLRGQHNTLIATSEIAKNGSERPNLLLLILLGAAGAAFFGAGIVLSGDALPFGIVGGLILLVVAAVLWHTGRSVPSAAPSAVASALGQQANDAESATIVARQLLQESAAALSLDGQPKATVLDSEEARLESARNTLDIWHAAKSRVEETSRRQKTQEQRVETADQDHAAAETSLQGVQEEWRHWLRERGVAETLTADSMHDFRARVETARVSLEAVNGMRRRVAAIRVDIDQFREKVESLAIAHGIAFDPDDLQQLASAADILISRLDEARVAMGRRQLAVEQQKEAQQLLERHLRRLQSEEQDISALLASGGTEDPEEFRRRARQHGERLDLERQRDEYRRSLERLSGPGDKLDAFRKLLANADPNELQEEFRYLSNQQVALEGRRNILREERGGIDKELAQLTSEEESSSLRLQRTILLEQLKEYAREWSRLTIAEGLLKRTQKKFERDRQPSVIKDAEHFFSKLTAQRYRRLFAPIGEQTINVTDSMDATKQPGKLSRGTREQLYLALRFGLIREFGMRTERLPVIVDEVLVNFDPERARLAAQSFAELAQTNQVLVFTCHPAIADMFANTTGAQVLDISTEATQ